MQNRIRARHLATAAHWFVAATFAAGGLLKLWPAPTEFDYPERFIAWGYPAGFQFVVGALELACAVMFALPSRRFRFIGASIAVLVLTGAVTTHIVNHDPLGESAPAPIVLIMVTVIALANWPTHWRELLRLRRDTGAQHQLPRMPSTKSVEASRLEIGQFGFLDVRIRASHDASERVRQKS